MAAAKPSRRLPAKAATGAGAGSPAIVRNAPDRPALLAPGASGADRPAAALKPRSPAASPPAAAAPVRTAEELARARLARLTEQLRRVIADAQALAAGGTQNALSLARSMLQRTLVPLLTSIDRVLAPFGLRLPSSETATATSGGTGLANLLAPVRGILDSVRQMLQRWFGRG